MPITLMLNGQKVKGKEWKTKNRSELPWSMLLDGSTWANAPEKPKPKQVAKKVKSELNNDCPCDDYLNSIIDSTDLDFSSGHDVTDKEKSMLTNLHDTNNVRDSNLIPFIIIKDLDNIKVEALIDTGALNHNYISRKVADQLGLKLVESRNINFCGGLNNSCKVIKTFITYIDVVFYDDVDKRTSSSMKWSA